MTEAMLEPHLKKEAAASQVQVALAFVALGGSYLITLPSVGFVWESHLWSELLTNVCSFLVCRSG